MTVNLKIKDLNHLDDLDNYNTDILQGGVSIAVIPTVSFSARISGVPPSIDTANLVGLAAAFNVAGQSFAFIS